MDTVCPRSGDPNNIVTFYKKGSKLLGHTVASIPTPVKIKIAIDIFRVI